MTDGTSNDPQPLKAAVTVQEIAPGDFRYWIVHLAPGPTARVAEHSPKSYPTEESAWRAGVEECRRVIAKVPTEKAMGRQAEIRLDIEAARREVEHRR